MLVARRNVSGLLVALALSFGSAVSTASAAVTSVSCGDTFSGSGVLTGDLDCSQPETPPIRIEHGRLDLRGFTLLGAIVCEGACKISNGVVGGPITGVKAIGVRNAAVYGDIRTNGNVRVTNSTVASGDRCVSAYYGKIVVESSVITGCRTTAIDANQNRVKMSDSSVTGNRQIGVHGTKVLLKSSEVTGNGFGIECGRSWLDFVCDGGPDHGLACGPGVDCAGGTCVRGAVCADVAAHKTPVLHGSSCDTSVDAGNAPRTWYVCSLD